MVKIDIQEANEKNESTFPKLMQLRHDRKIIVYFHSEDEGTILSHGHHLRDIFSQGEWLPCSDEAWVPFTGKIVISND